MYEAELEVALTAARRAGELILNAYAAFTAIPNAPIDISTDADKASQELILTELRQHFPNDALCAEEATPTLASAPRSGSRLWIVDPIDGTRGFATKNGEFSVMIGFAHEGALAAGVVLEPVAGRSTFASRGFGCWIDDGQGRQPCRVSTNQDMSALTLAQSRSRDGSPTRAVQLLQPVKVLETHSAGLKLALVARGRADAFVNHYTAFHDWDICAGQILVEEAGGRVTGLRGETIRYGEPGAWQRSRLLASNGTLHAPILARYKDEP